MSTAITVRASVWAQFHVAFCLCISGAFCPRNMVTHKGQHLTNYSMLIYNFPHISDKMDKLKTNNIPADQMLQMAA